MAAEKAFSPTQRTRTLREGDGQQEEGEKETRRPLSRPIQRRVSREGGREGAETKE